MKIVRFILFPFAILYGVITSIRNWLFDIGVLKSTSFDIPVIVVGNLSVGGTGKTPQIEYLVRLLKNDFKIATLSRGYGRKTKGFLKLNKSHIAQDVGDEPLQYFRKFGEEITIAVDENRTNGIQQLLKNEPLDAVLLDDAYQHRKVKASTYVLLTKYSDLYSDDFILPTGNLRESRRGAGRADIVIVTKCPANLSIEAQEKIKHKLKLHENQELFFTTILYDTVLRGGKKTLKLDDLENKKVILLTGIANPIPLLAYLSGKNIQFEHLKFADHHYFSNSDLKKIRKKSTGKIIITTEKDFVRLNDEFDDLFYVSIKTEFLSRKKLFDATIKKYISG